MSDDSSARLGLPYLAAGQLQKHVTLNEALTRLDGLVQTAVVSRMVTAQPASPADGALYILPPTATGAVWATYDTGDLLRAELGGWTVVPVPDGLLAWVGDEGVVIVRHDGAWIALGEGLGEVQGLTRLGLNTTADATNPFAARVNKALWTAVNAGDGGDGDLRLTFNKEAASDVLSLLFQSGYGGRAELGLIGADDLSLKVSADGSAWHSAMVVDRTSGAVAFPAGGGRVEVTVLTASGTFTVPPWARAIEVVAVGGGGGGGSGAVGASGVARYGGGGGGAGGSTRGLWATGDLASSLTVVVGAGGTGAAGVSSGAGSAGANGGASSVASAGVIVIAGLGGGGGQGGSSTNGLGGAGGAGATNSNPGGDSTTAPTPTAPATVRPEGPGGGGAGGGLNTTTGVRPGIVGGQGGVTSTPTAGGSGGSAAAGGAGAGAANPVLSCVGGGGGGGGASNTLSHAGGAGGTGGGGGGGGGASVVSSGAGGAGGAGLVRITAIG